MANRMQPILDKLREDMPEDVKYVTVERQESTCALNVFFLVGEQWRVARGVDHETIRRRASPNIMSGVEQFWGSVEGGAVLVEDTDDEPPKRWAAANELATKLLIEFKLGQEFWDHKGWRSDGVYTLSLEEQESMAGEIVEFIKPLLMKEADVPFPRRLPLPTVACSECGAGVPLRRHKDTNGFVSVSIDGHIRTERGNFVVRCYKCPPKIGPITVDGCLEGAEEIRKHDETIRKSQEALKDPTFLTERITLPDAISKESMARLAHDAMHGNPAEGCTCGAWVTKQTHASHCDLSTAGG